MAFNRRSALIGETARHGIQVYLTETPQDYPRSSLLVPPEAIPEPALANGFVWENVADTTVTHQGGSRYKIERTASVATRPKAKTTVAALSAAPEITVSAAPVSGFTGQDNYFGIVDNVTDGIGSLRFWGFNLNNGQIFVYNGAGGALTTAVAINGRAWVVRGSDNIIRFYNGPDLGTATLLYTTPSDNPFLTGDRFGYADFTDPVGVSIETLATGPVSSIAIVPANIAQAQSTTSPTIATASVVAPDNVTQAQSTTSPTLAAASTVAPDNIAQSQAITVPTISYTAPATVITPADVAQAQSTTSPTIAVRYALTPDNVAQDQSTTSPTLAAGSSVAPADVAQAQTTTSPFVGVIVPITPADVVQAQATTSPSLALGPLPVSSISQTQIFTSPTIAYSIGSGRIGVWLGSWQKKPVKVREADAWVSRPVKIWNGAAWVLAP